MSDTENKFVNSNIGKQLRNNRFYQIGEILLLFLTAFAFIQFTKPLIGDNLILKQAVFWFANILMLLIFWIGVRLRGESFKDFGLSFKSISRRECVKVILLSILVFVIAVSGFIVGSIIMANITGIPESSNMTGYDYLKNNILMLLLTLAGVLIVSSFGEEVIYRGFLINRISQIGSNSKTSRVIAVILSSIIFGLVHYEWGPMGIVQTGFMGLGLGICYLKLKKRLWILILAHAYMDTILMFQLYLSGN